MARATHDMEDDFSFDAGHVDDDQGSEDKLDIQHYLRVLRKHKWAIALFSAAVTALAGYYAYTATPIYSATSTLLIETQQQTNVVSIEELVGSNRESSDYYQTQFELLKSRGLAERVISHLDLWTDSELSPASSDNTTTQGASATSDAGGVGSIVERIGGAFSNDSATQQAVTAAPVAPESDALTLDLSSEAALADSTSELGSVRTTSRAALAKGRASRDRLTEREQSSVVAAFMGRLTIAPTRGTKLVRISFESADPVFAALVANTVGEQYIDSYLDSKLEMTTIASSWLNDRLGDLKEQLDDAEQRLIDYKQDNGLVDVNGSVGRLNEQELLLATNELAEARSALAASSDVFNEVNAARGQPLLLENIVAIQSDPLIQNVRTEQGQRQRELDELLNRYGDRHPTVVDARSRLGSLNATMNGHVNRVIGSIQKDFQLLQQRVRSIEAKLTSGKEEILVLGTKKFELDEREREVATKRDLYNTFFSRITEANSADGLETANARISDYATTPSFPVKPRKQLIIALAGLASLVLSILMALLYEQMDGTVKGISDVEEKVGLKLIGIIPLIKGGMFGKTNAALPLNPLQIDDKKGTFFESINTIRTAISIDDGSKPKKVIVVTSSVPGEGKSTTSINLAYSMAQMQRVLLIDCDMRRPSLARCIGEDKSSRGLSNLIAGTATARQCINRGVFDGRVDLLMSGPLPEHPLEMLSSKRFEKILEKLRDHYDRIIIDSAPTQAVSDALVLSKLADSVVYAIKSHDTEINLVRQGIKRLRQVKAPLEGAVMTQVDVAKLASYGGDYYYQGYYDYYGYNTHGEKPKNKLQLTQDELMAMKTDDRDVELDLDYDYSSNDGRRSRASNDSMDLTQEIADSRDSRGRGQRRRAVNSDLDIL